MLEIKTINNKESLHHLKKLNEGGVIMKPNLSQLARSLNISRETARKYYNGYQKKYNRCKISKVQKHHDFIKEIFESNDKKVYYISQLHRYICDKKSDCDYSRATLARYIKQNFSDYDKKKKKTYTRYETQPGVEAQCDFKEKQKLVNKDNEVMSVTTITVQLGYSRKRYRRILANKQTEAVIDALASIFAEMGGVPEYLKFDNDKVFVSEPKSENNPEAILTARFSEFLKDFNIKARVCPPYYPEAKGKVESTMKALDALHLYSGDFNNLFELNEIVQKITNYENSTFTKTIFNFPDVMFDVEKEALKPLPKTDIISNYTLTLQRAKVNNCGLINHKDRYYSVPTDLIGKMIYKHCTDKTVHLYYNKVCIAEHNISDKKFNYLPGHQVHKNKLTSKSVPNKVKTDARYTGVKYEENN